MTPTSDVAERLEALLAKATPGPWAYRPNDCDDWGYIRTTVKIGGWLPVVAISRGDEEHGLHRARGTDPYEPNGQLIVEAINALPQLLAERRALREALQSSVDALHLFLLATGPNDMQTCNALLNGKLSHDAARATLNRSQADAN